MFSNKNTFMAFKKFPTLKRLLHNVSNEIMLLCTMAYWWDFLPLRVSKLSEVIKILHYFFVNYEILAKYI